MIDKRVGALDEAVADVPHGATVMISGFGESGVPNVLIGGLVTQGATDLTVIANNAGSGEHGVAALLRAGRVKRIICSYPRSRGSVWFERRYLAGEVELDVVAQGTLSERIRAGGAGIPAFFTPTGVGTALAEGKESRVLGGCECLLEYALWADVALIKGRAADRWGNLVYHAAARNYAPTMAMAATTTIAEVDEVVALGELEPETIVTPGIFVQRVVCELGREEPLS
jgi:3-oxoadipate CoA-transferase alpha subunit